jgi:protein-L-isoaspartate(D-aspartate) O-methyltransferase
MIGTRIARLLCCVAVFALLAPTGCNSEGGGYEERRHRMVKEQIASRGISDRAVLAAMMKVPRHRFVPPDLGHLAYIDSPLPIGSGQTISQPYIVALMTQSLGLKDGGRVLEIGTGSGYQAAVLAEIADTVYTIEIIPGLADRAQRLLGDLGYRNVFVRAGDGYFGWPDKAPFDGVIVTAAAPELPPRLVEQLKIGGRFVIPVGESFQNLEVYEKRSDGLVLLSTLPVRFVPMTGVIRESDRN